MLGFLEITQALTLADEGEVVYVLFEKCVHAPASDSGYEWLHYAVVQLHKEYTETYKDHIRAYYFDSERGCLKDTILSGYIPQAVLELAQWLECYNKNASTRIFIGSECEADELYKACKGQ